jgi:hypothetical protein
MFSYLFKKIGPYVISAWECLTVRKIQLSPQNYDKKISPYVHHIWLGKKEWKIHNILHLFTTVVSDIRIFATKWIA